ncbi:MAG: hypothetical protein HZA46_11975 [Planctomycetales bacterium]|nr:hypothetical protein [Planctomycetales bacterium]
MPDAFHWNMLISQSGGSSRDWEADDMTWAMRDLIRLLLLLVALSGCRGSGWSASMNSDTMAPAIGLSLGGQPKKARSPAKSSLQSTAPSSRAKKTAALASGPEGNVPPVEMPNSDSANSSRTRQANWWSPRSWRRTTPDRIPLPITDQTTAEATSPAANDDF